VSRKLPEHNMTLDEFRALITRHAYRAQRRFGSYIDLMAGKPGALSKREHAEFLTAHHATLYGWATVSLLGFIRDRLGDDAAFEAAAMVDDMGANGGAPFTGDLPYPPAEAEVSTR